MKSNGAEKIESKRAVLMLNLGGPASLENVETFLRSLFCDREMIYLPFQRYMADLIVKMRLGKIKNQYERIGGSSPIHYWTKKQGEKLVSKLNDLSKNVTYKYYIAFRHSKPSTEDALRQIINDQIDDVIVFSQYPHFSCTTTGSSLNELYRNIVKFNLEKDVKWSVIERWSDDIGYANSVAFLIRSSLETWSKEVRDRVVILFSAHSIPYYVHDRGDLYTTEIVRTISNVMNILKVPNPYRVAWQSKVGPIQWMGPHIHTVLSNFKKLNCLDVLIVPISFTSDQLETLYEIDEVYIKKSNELGMNVKRIPSLNDTPLFLDSLTNLVLEHVENRPKISQQFLLVCSKCKNAYCTKTRNFFAPTKHHINP